MSDSFLPHEIDRIKKLLREGLYWVALRLLPNASFDKIDIRIAGLEQACQGDQEALTLLDEARQDLRNGNYPAAKRFCDEFFTKLDDQFGQRIFGEAVISREGFWQELIRPRLHTFSDDPDGRDIKHILADTLCHIGVTLVNKAQDKLVSNSITSSTAIRAINKGIHALEITQIYSDNPEPAGEQLKTAKKLASSLYYDCGVERINQAQGELKEKIDYLQSRANTEDIEPLYSTVQNVIDAAMAEVQTSIADIEKAQQLDRQNPKVHEQLKVAKELLSNNERLRNNTLIAIYYSRGVQRINKAQEDLNTKLKKMSPVNIMGVDGRNALNTAITEIRRGIVDIKKAQQLDSENSHMQEQLEIANDLLNRLDPQRIEVDSNDVPIYNGKNYLCRRDNQNLEAVDIAIMGVRAYYCKKENLCWIHDSGDLKPCNKWYGPYTGYPDAFFAWRFMESR